MSRNHNFYCFQHFSNFSIISWSGLVVHPHKSYTIECGNSFPTTSMQDSLLKWKLSAKSYKTLYFTSSQVQKSHKFSDFTKFVLSGYNMVHPQKSGKTLRGWVKMTPGGLIMVCIQSKSMYLYVNSTLPCYRGRNRLNKLLIIITRKTPMPRTWLSEAYNILFSKNKK